MKFRVTLSSNLQYRFAASKSEILAAQRIVHASFDFSRFNLNPRLKEFESDLEVASFQNYFLALDSDNVIGVVRTVPRVINFKEFTVPALEWTDFATTGLGIEFQGMHLLSHFFSTDYVDRFALVLGNARKIMDDYYFRFGFFGVSAFPTLLVERSEYIATTYRIEKVENFDQIDTFQLEEFRMSSNEPTNGFLERTSLEWEVFFSKIISGANLALYNVSDEQDQLIGYFIRSSNAIVECSLPEYFSFPEFLSVLMDILPKSEIVFRLPLKHTLFRNLGRGHFSVSYRRIPNSGIICKVTNSQELLKCIANSKSSKIITTMKGTAVDLASKEQEKEFVLRLFGNMNYEESLFGLELAWHLANFDFSGEFFL